MPVLIILIYTLLYLSGVLTGIVYMTKISKSMAHNILERLEEKLKDEENSDAEKNINSRMP